VEYFVELFDLYDVPDVKTHLLVDFPRIFSELLDNSMTPADGLLEVADYAISHVWKFLLLFKIYNYLSFLPNRIFKQLFFRHLKEVKSTTFYHDISFLLDVSPF
jgi:hypothetical protein